MVGQLVIAWRVRRIAAYILTRATCRSYEIQTQGESLRSRYEPTMKSHGQVILRVRDPVPFW